MAEYVRILSLSDIAAIHLRFGEAIRLARQIEATYARSGNRVRAAEAGAKLREVQRAYAEFNSEMRSVATKTAANARRQIARQIAITRSGRPDTGNNHHLRDAVRVRALQRFGPLATGEVGIADVGVLDLVVNPRSPQYGTYWRSQEEGYRPRGRQLTGIAGGFFGPGGSPGPFAPDPAQSRAHPIFQTGRASGVRGGGLLKLTRPIPGRHFIAKGAAAAEAVWRADLAAIESRAEARLAAITAPFVGR